jgi:hypothetical protein
MAMKHHSLAWQETDVRHVSQSDHRGTLAISTAELLSVYEPRHSVGDWVLAGALELGKAREVSLQSFVCSTKSFGLGMRSLAATYATPSV